LTGPELPSSPGVAAFDFDGTLVAGDSLRPFLIALLGRPAMADALLRAASPMLRAYVRGGRDEAKAALLHRTLAGISLERATTVGTRFGASLAGRIRPQMLEEIRWHRSRDHRLIVVSASLTVYLDEFARRAGFHQVIASRLAVTGSGPGAVLSGSLEGANVRGHEKERRLRRVLGHGPCELWAYGDSDGDREMLAMADHAYRVSRRRPGGAR